MLILRLAVEEWGSQGGLKKKSEGWYLWLLWFVMTSLIFDDIITALLPESTFEER